MSQFKHYYREQTTLFPTNKDINETEEQIEVYPKPSPDHQNDESIENLNMYKRKPTPKVYSQYPS